jgi:hypothetical protein
MLFACTKYIRVRNGFWGIIMDTLSQLTLNLIERLEKQGIEHSLMPGFLRSLVQTIFLDPDVNLVQVNQKLHLLGWDGFELDYHTLELAIACFEAEGLKSFEPSQPAVLRSFISRVHGDMNQ